MRRLLRLSGQILLTLGAVLGTVCIVLAIMGAAYDVKPLIFRSGSMAPAIPAGGLALAKPVPVADLQVGDIVSVRSDGTRITHRIRTIERVGKAADLTLKGDANRVPDADPYRVKSADRVFFHVPYAGYVVSYASGPVGLVVTGMVASLLLWLVVRPSRRGGGDGTGAGDRRRRQVGGVRKRSAAALLLLAAGVVAPISLAPVPTWATFSDQGTATGGSLAAHKVQRPASVGCSTSGSNATFSWTEVDPRYDYEILLWRDEATDVLVSTVQVTGAALSRQYNKDSGFGLSGSLIGTPATYNFFVTVRSWLSGTAAPNRWQSSDVRQSTQRVRIQITCTIILLCTVNNPTCVA